MGRRKGSKTYYQTHKKEILEQQKIYKKEHKDLIKQCNKKYYDKNKEKYKQLSQNYYQNHKQEKSQHWRKYQYGITKEQFIEMLRKQNYKCAICNSNFKNSRDTHIDHNHKTGKIRGLLCFRCNNILGVFENTNRYLFENYLNKWSDC